jgi:plastocyanin
VRDRDGRRLGAEGESDGGQEKNEQKDLGIEKVVFDKDSPQTVKFTPTQTGTYQFKCAKFCGMGHSGMKGQIVVVE